MNAAGAGYQASLAAIDAQFSNLQKGLSNAIAAKPLPVDCKPDAGRVRQLAAAVAAANLHAAAP